MGKIPWKRKWQPTPVFLPGKSHGQRSLVGYSPQGHKESDTTEATLHICIHILSLQASLKAEVVSGRNQNQRREWLLYPFLQMSTRSAQFPAEAIQKSPLPLSPQRVRKSVSPILLPFKGMVFFKVRTEEKLWTRAVKGKELVVKREAKCLVLQFWKFLGTRLPTSPF